MLSEPRKKGHKRISTDYAREIEKLCGEPRGALDGEANEIAEHATLYGLAITQGAVDVGREWDKLREPIKSQISTLIETLVAQQVRDESQAAAASVTAA